MLKAFKYVTRGVEERERKRERERELKGDGLERWESSKVVFYINKSSIYRENKRQRDKVEFKESDSGCLLGSIVKSKSSNFSFYREYGQERIWI